MDTKSPSLNKNCDEFSGGGEEKKKEKKKHTSFNIRRMGRKKDKADRATGLGRARRGREIQKKRKGKGIKRQSSNSRHGREGHIRYSWPLFRAGFTVQN